jgi:flagellar biosynthesis protein FlhA
VIAAIRKSLGNQGDLILVLSLVGILVVLFSPIPAGLLDFLFIANFSLALLILLLTFYMAKPLEFSTFPSLLLIATLFRLSLNIAATRLILSEASAGQVIDAVGDYVVSGNYIIGLIVFLVLVVVQYVVVTNGAQRVAEVAARFTLDSMPGKQMSIDAELNLGLIDEKQAREQRKNIEKEANFYGAMDGASKFVKGDAIAGIIIILIDIIGGLTIGIVQHGMAWADALQTYTLLTIGDGIVTQVPALVIATATGIIVTRASSDAQLSNEVTRQITSYPKSLVLVALMLCGILFLPGIPILPALILLALVVAITVFAYKVKNAKAVDAAKEKPKETGEAEDIYSTLTVEPIEVTVGQNLISMVGNEDSLFMERIVAFRKQYASEMGFVVPKVRIRDNKKLSPNAYQIHIYGTKVAEREILSDRILAINPGGESEKLEGVETRDPAYGLPAVWIVEDARQKARAAGYTLVDPPTVLMTHISEVVRQQSPNLLTRAETERLVNRVRQQHASLIEELMPKVLSMGEAQKVLQNLLREKVSIRNIEFILEVLADHGPHNKDPEHLTELVRQKLGPAICQTLTNPSGELYVLTLDPAVEQNISSAMRNIDGKSALILEPKFAERLLVKMAGEVERMMGSNMMPVLLCNQNLRRHLRQFTERVMPHLSVLSLSEVPNSVNLKAFGMVNL